MLPREEGSPVNINDVIPLPESFKISGLDGAIDKALTRAKVINTMADYIVAVGGREANQDFLDYVNNMQPKLRKLKLSEYREHRRKAERITEGP